MPISCHLHSTWLSYLGGMPHTLRTFSHFSLLYLLGLNALMLWNWFLPIFCYILVLYNIGAFLSLSKQFFRICSSLAPHIMVPGTFFMRNSLVVYVDMADLPILLVFFDRNASFLFLRTLAWRGGIFVPCNPNQMWAQYIYPLPNSLLSRSAIWVHLWGVLNVICLGILLQICQLPGWNISTSIYDSINPGWFYFVNICVLIIALLVFFLPRVLLTTIHTLLFLFLTYTYSYFVAF